MELLKKDIIRTRMRIKLMEKHGQGKPVMQEKARLLVQKKLLQDIVS